MHLVFKMFDGTGGSNDGFVKHCLDDRDSSNDRSVVGGHGWRWFLHEFFGDTALKFIDCGSCDRLVAIHVDDGSTIVSMGGTGT